MRVVGKVSEWFLVWIIAAEMLVSYPSFSQQVNAAKMLATAQLNWA